MYGGEILGIAGISGNGQKELLEAIAGLQHTESGSDVKFFAPGEEDKPMELLGKSPKDIRDAGVHLSFVPEDRLGMGLVGTMGMTGQHDAEKAMAKAAPRCWTTVPRVNWPKRSARSLAWLPPA